MIAFGIMIEINYYIQEAITGAYKDKNGTWFASARHKNWAGEAKKMKRGFSTKREALAWEREFIAKNDGNLEMTFQSFCEVYKNNLQNRLREIHGKQSLGL